MRLPAALLPLFVLPFVGLLVSSVVVRAETPAGQSSSAPASGTPSRTILFLGDSLTAGYGLNDASSQAFPALIERRLRETGHAGEFQVVNAGVSGDTTAGGLRRVDWLLSRRAPDVFILELGGNDGLRGLPTAETERNLRAIIEKVRAKNPAVRVLVTNMILPPNVGKNYFDQFVAVFPAVAAAENAKQIPIFKKFLDQPELIQRDGIHPTAEGHRVIAGAVWEVLEPVLREGEVTSAATTAH